MEQTLKNTSENWAIKPAESVLRIMQMSQQNPPVQLIHAKKIEIKIL